jgi:hypothetical protein
MVANSDERRVNLIDVSPRGSLQAEPVRSNRREDRRRASALCRTFDGPALAAIRRDALRSFGSPSFDEPREGLQELGMLA